jgi:uncharacterized protein YhaN
MEGMTRTLTIVWIVFFVGSLHAQSLADAAKKAEEKRGAAAGQTSKTKVYTKKDVEALPPEVVTSPSKATSTETSAAAASEPESSDKAEPAKDEAYWKSRMAPLQAQLDRDRSKLATARTDLRNLEVYMVPTQWNWTVYGRDWQRLTNEVSTSEAAVRDDEKRIADLEEEARVAGALPGWLR